MCNDRNSFITFKKLCKSLLIELGDKSTVIASHYGLVNISGSKLEAIYTPTFRVSLLSIGQLDRTGALSTFGQGAFTISPGGMSISGTRIRDLYVVNTTAAATAYTSENTAPPIASATAPAASPATSASRSKKNKRKRSMVEVRQAAPTPRATVSVTAKSISESRLWHRRCVHLHPAPLQSLIDGFTHDDAMCNVYIQAKHKQKFICTTVQRATTPFELVHSDVCVCVILYLISRYMRPEGPWQRLRRCLSSGSSCL